MRRDLRLWIRVWYLLAQGMGVLGRLGSRSLLHEAKLDASSPERSQGEGVAVTGKGGRMSLDGMRGYLEFLASLGMTKHPGSMEATRRLVALCQIHSGQLVLDVGTGVGATPVYLVREVGCCVVGVDLLERMVQQARERARGNRVEGRAVFAASEARRLPFRDGTFDAVIMESLNVFFEDKLSAIREYARVTRRGGSVGMSELTWLREPSAEQAAYYRRTVYADTLQPEGWLALLEEAGLVEVAGHAEPIDMPQESRGRLQRYGCSGLVRVMVNAVTTMVKDRSSRAFVADVSRSLPRNYMEGVGYGVYAGRKP